MNCAELYNFYKQDSNYEQIPNPPKADIGNEFCNPNWKLQVIAGC